MANIYKTKLDIKDVQPDFKPVFVQYDHAILEFELMDSIFPYDLSNIERVEFTHIRGDGLTIIQPGEIVTVGDKKIITYEYEGTEMDVIGPVETSLATFDSNNKKVSSHSFFVEIKKDLRDEPFNPAEPNYGLLQKLIDDVDYIKEHGGSGGIGPKGDKGDKGDPGEPGPPGSDANVTNSNVISALGFTPAKSTDIGNIQDLVVPNTNLVGAMNNAFTQLFDEIGIVGTLNTVSKNLTGAVNEVNTSITTHKTNNAPHQYGGKFEWRFNPTTNSLDLVVLE